MHCIVTAGPTFEPMDQVRRLTNFSTGRLGSELARFLSDRGHQVTLLIGQQASWRGGPRAGRVETFTTAASLGGRLRELAGGDVGAVFHAAAVGDFLFGRIFSRGPGGELTEVQAGKISTRQGALLAELTPTPKIISQLRGWFPAALLVGWKYEVDGGRAGAIEAACEQIRQCRTDACVANGPAYGAGFGLIKAGAPCLHLDTARRLYEALEAMLRR